jgi:phage/plasmid-associated DNA primase
MRENYSTFPPTHKIVICGNHMLSAHDSGEAFHRRVRLVPFEQVIPEGKRDPKLAEKLRRELSGILNWAIAGCLTWQRDGLGMSDRVRAASARYREESDRLAGFFADACIVVPLARVSRPSLKAAYESWCEREHERPMGPKEFAEQLRQRGITEIKMKVAGVSTRGWQGIGLLSGGQVVTSGQHLPVNRLEEVSRGVNRQTTPVPDHLTTPDDNAQAEGPSAAGVLGNCTRVRPDSTVTPADVEVLQAHLAGLNGTAQATVDKLWTYWKGAPAPSVSEFLERETRELQGGAR